MESTNNYMETDLGNVSPNPKGTYDNATAYEYLDLVEYQGGSYLCTVDIDKKVKGISPTVGQNSETWQLVALPGTSTEEYVAKHTEVIEKAKQVETSRAAVELCKQEVESAQADVEQMRQDTQQAAQNASDANKEAQQAAQQAEASRSEAQTSEQNAAASRDLANTYKANAETARVQRKQRHRTQVKVRQPQRQPHKMQHRVRQTLTILSLISRKRPREKM